MKLVLGKFIHLLAIVMVFWKLNMIKCQMLLLEMSIKK